MSETQRQLLIWSAGPLLLLALLGWSVQRSGANARGAQRAWAELQTVQDLASQIADVGGTDADPNAGEGGLFGQIQSVADGADIDGTQLANLERVEPAFGDEPSAAGARMDLRGVRLSQIITFLEAWAHSASGRGARTINLIPEGDDHDDLWTAQLRLDG